MKRFSLTFYLNFYSLLFLVAFVSCRSSQTSSQNNSQTEYHNQKEDMVELTFLHINDVYEIGGVSGGKYGNLARIAQLKKQLLEENPNTYLILSGDFLNPSVLGTLKLEEKRISGQQMIEVMNAAKVDFVTFGNHEFDLKENEVLDRINESTFEWIASNTFYYKNEIIQPFTKNGKKLPSYITIQPINEKGQVVSVGILGITTDYNQPEFVRYTDEYQTAKNIYNQIKTETDFTVALTHLLENEDEKLAEVVPELKLLMGGHDHENMKFVYGKTTIAKADANARTAYIHRLTYNKKTKELKINSELKTIDNSINYEPITKAIIKKWDAIADSVFEAQGFNPDKEIYKLNEPLEARESVIRTTQTNAGKLIVDAMADAFPDAELALLGSGSVRLDDRLIGTITEYDVLRMLPFGGKIYQFTTSGDILTRFLDAGIKNTGNGGYLQYQQKLKYDTQEGWLLNGKKIEKDKPYKLVTNDYNLTGRENNMEFMKAETNEEIKNVISSDDPQSPQSDIRKAVIVYLEKM